MTSPPESFRAHDASAFVCCDSKQTLNAGFELLRFHIVGITAKGVIAPGRVWRTVARFAATAQCWKVFISDASFSQALGQRRQAELRVATRTGKTTNISDDLNFASAQQSNKFFKRQRRMANGPKLESPGFRHESISNGQWKLQRAPPAPGATGTPALPRMSDGLNFGALPRSFYLPSAKKVAPLLLGHFLFRNTPQGMAGD